MTTFDGIRVDGEHLATARRAVSVALVVGVAGDEKHEISELLPDRFELEHLLAVVGWPGAEPAEVVLDADDATVLAQVVDATLILALDEVEKDAYRALRAPERRAKADPAALVAVETLSGLALILRGDADPVSDVPPAAPVQTDAAKIVPTALNALADGVTLPLWVADIELAFEWVNPAFTAVVGSQQAAGSSWRRWCDPADIARVSQVVDAATLEQRNWSVEAGIGPAGGPYARLLIVAAPRLAPDGALVGWSGICFDVSADARLATRLEPMSASLTAESARTHLLVRQFPGMIWTTDDEGRCTSMVGSGLAAIGRDPIDCIGRSLSDLLAVADPADPAIRAHADALAGISGFFVHTCCGRDFETHVEPLRDARGDAVGVIGISHDITDRNAKSDENRRLVRLLELAQRIGRIGSWEYEVGTGEYLLSDEAYRILGYAPGAAEPTFEAFIDRVIPGDRERVTTLYEERMRSGIGFQMDFRILRIDGKLRTVRGSVEFEHDRNGALERILGTIQDVTVADVVTGQSVDLSTLLGMRASSMTTTRVRAPGP